LNSRKSGLAVLAIVVVWLSGCSAADDSDQLSSNSSGMIALAVSETCAEGSSPECASVNDQHVVLPASFERAGVKDAVVAEAGGQNAVEVTFTDEGAAVFAALTEEAAQAGGDARLVIKIGDEIRATVMVVEPLSGDSVMIALSPDDSAQEVVDLISND